jgi:hypothetical protein
MAAELVVVVVVEPPDLTVALIVRFMCPTGPFAGMMASVSRYLLTPRGQAMVRPSGIRGTGSTRVRVGRPLNHGLRARAVIWRPCGLPGCAASAVP